MAERERRLAAEFLQATFPEGTWALNVELGPIPAEDVVALGTRRAAARLRPWRRRIDAVHWNRDRYDLIEVKIRDPLPGLGGLQVYEVLARLTPDLVGYEGQPFHKVLVTPYSLAWIRAVAEDLGIELVEFYRDWISDYVRDIQLYFTADYRRERDRRKDLRRLLGVD